MKILSCKNFTSQNSLSSLDTIDSPVQFFDKIFSQKKIPQRPMLNRIISKEELRQAIAQDNFSGKGSLHNLDTQSPVKLNKIILAKKQQNAAPTNISIDTSSDDETDQFIIPQFYMNKNTSSQQICCIDDEFENESNSDELNIWNSEDALSMGIDVENAETPFEFCQLYYIRSQLYQANKVTKNNVLDEVQVISNMCRKKMNMVQSNKLIDSVERDYHITLKKSEIHISKLKFQKTQLARPLPVLGNSVSQKETPKAFRISQYNLSQSPKKQPKQTFSSNIFDQEISPIYQNGRQLLVKPNTNMNRIQIESLPVMSILKQSSQPEVSNNSRVTSPQKNVHLILNLKNSTKTTGIYKTLGKTMSHSKFHPIQEINV